MIYINTYTAILHPDNYNANNAPLNYSNKVHNINII